MSFLQRFFGPPNIENLKNKRDIKGLIKALNYKQDENVCKAAADALGEIGEQAIEILIATLRIAIKNNSLRMRRETVDGLVKIGSPAVDSLIIALKDQDSTIRYEVAKVLGKIGDTRSFEPLTNALRDNDSPVREAATEALRHIGALASEPLVAPVIEPLIAALLDEDLTSKAREVVAMILKKINDEEANQAILTYQKRKEVTSVLSKFYALAEYVRKSKHPETVLERVGFFDAKDPIFIPAGHHGWEVTKEHKDKTVWKASAIAPESPLPAGLSTMHIIVQESVQYYVSTLQDLLLIRTINDFITTTTVAPLLQKLEGAPLSESVYTEVSLNAIARLVQEKIGRCSSAEELRERVLSFIRHYPKGVVRAEILDLLVKPTKVKILEGKYAKMETILPGVNLVNLRIQKGDIVFVKPVEERGKLIKTEYKGKFVGDI